MAAEEISAAVPVAGKMVDTFGVVSPPVQIAIVVGLTLVGLVLACGWAWPRLRSAPATPEPAAAPADDGNEDAIALARAIVALSDELARHVAHLANAVDAMLDTIKRMDATIRGCQSCPHLPHNERTKPHAG